MAPALPIEELSDEDLLERSEQDPSAFSALLSRYQRLFLDKALSVTKDRDSAEDVVQDAFVRIYRFSHKFNRNGGTFKSWALTILMNVARTHYQRKSVSRSRFASLEPEHYESLGDTDAPDPEAADVIRRAMGKAPDDVAHILTLAFLEGLPYREIAEREDSTVGAVKTRVHRAKKVVYDIIKRQESGVRSQESEKTL